MKYLTAFWDFVDTRAVVRRIMTLGTFSLTVHVIVWAVWFATTSPRSGGDIALIIAAVMGPVNVLQGYMFARYSQARQREKV